MATTPPKAPNKQKNRRTLMWLLGGAGVLILALVVWMALFPKKSAAPTFTTAVVTQGPLEKVVAATGKVVANFEVEIKAKASGKIIRLPYDVSDVVHTGDLLVQLDPIDENRNVSQAQASLSGLESKSAQSRVNLSVAQRTLATDIARARADLRAAQAKAKDAASKAHRLNTLAQQRYISQEEAETGRTTQAQSQTGLQNAQVRLRELQTQQLSLQAQAEDVAYASNQAQAQRVALASAEQRLSETRIYAPISGVVTTRAGQLGQIIASGISNVGGGTAIMTLADLSHIFVLASVDESDIGQVREGQTVNITADSYPGQQFQGKVVRIAPEGVEETNVVTFEVKIEVLGANKNLLKPQMTTNVEIIADQRSNALQVPAEAVVKGRSGRTMVRVVGADGKPTRRPVTIGLNNGTNIEIVQGVSAGEKVVVGQGQAHSRWRKDSNGNQSGGGPGGGGNRRGQMTMMRGLGGGRR